MILRMQPGNSADVTILYVIKTFSSLFQARIFQDWVLIFSWVFKISSAVKISSESQFGGRASVPAAGGGPRVRHLFLAV